MRPQPSAHTSAWRSGEVVFGLPFLGALALQWLVPLGLPREPFGLVLVVVGVLLSVAGVVVIVLGRRELAAYDQPTDPGHPTRRLVTTGVEFKVMPGDDRILYRLTPPFTPLSELFVASIPAVPPSPGPTPQPSPSPSPERPHRVYLPQC